MLDRDAVVIGDGGDFVSYAGKYLEPRGPAAGSTRARTAASAPAWATPSRARITRPAGQVVLLLGDGAAGFSLMDVDTLVRHQLPVVMSVGNNGVWGLEKHPMQALYGYDVAADLQPQLPLRPGGRRARRGRRDGDAAGRASAPALRRAFALGRALPGQRATDPGDAYPRSTTGV